MKVGQHHPTIVCKLESELASSRAARQLIALQLPARLYGQKVCVRHHLLPLSCLTYVGCACLLAQDWPAKWQSFIPDLVNASRTNETLCENSMTILKLLSEEIFDFSQGEMTQVHSSG